MSSVNTLALIPARAGSKGIPGKNFRILGGLPLYAHAAVCAGMAGVVPIVISSDAADPGLGVGDWLQRPADLSQDDTPMLAVVQHALEQIPGPPDQIIALLQPTQPFRTPAHVQAAITLLQDDPVADSVVSVIELPPTLSPDVLCQVSGNRLYRWEEGGWDAMPTRRQDVVPAYKRDGTVYAFRRYTIAEVESIYGWECVPLIIPAAESCELDTEQDWASVERRWQELDRVRC